MTDAACSLLSGYFARFLAGRSGLRGSDGERFQQLVILLSRAIENGDSCLQLNEDDQRFMMASPLVSMGGRTPLVLHNQRLYLHRYYHYETRLAAQLRQLAAKTFIPVLDETALDRFFSPSAPSMDWQREAAKRAMVQALTIICGGPGTGKTTTVARILVLLLQAAVGGRNPAMALAAPTGKAAMRLSEAMGRSLARMQLSETMKNGLPEKASTLHRLLGVRRGSPQFRHNHDNPMEWDVVVVDEASMVDLALMSKLIDAIKPDARLILLGDKDQLASVESGAVLGDCVRSLPENTVELKKTYRFEGGIRTFAEAINRADSDTAWKLLDTPSGSTATLPEAELIPYICERYRWYMELAGRQETVDLQQLFASFNSFRVLSALHYGRRGVDRINRQIESWFMRRGLPSLPDSWYPGRPVLITVNDYNLDLYNGDVGICLASEKKGEFQVWFEQADGRWRWYPPSRLPPCETVYAMTVHKSQGSEFDEVVIVLPEEDNRILTRELVYTAVTRARKQVRLVVEKNILRLAVSRNIERTSGLADSLMR